MISIESSEENKFVYNLTKKSVPQAKYLWIGAKRTGSGILDFEWENESPFLYSNWLKNEPNNSGGDHHHVFILLEKNGQWADWTDKYNMNFICESTLINE
jgi:hypothetical protein